MDFVAALGTAALSSLINTAVIVALYTFWIIPKIVERVRDELMDKIVGWVEDLKQSLGQNIADSIDNVGEKIRRTLSGKRANAARQMKLAEEFLTANLPDEDDEDDDLDELRESVIGEAIGRYGSSVINTILSKISAKKAADEPIKDGVIKW